MLKTRKQNAERVTMNRLYKHIAKKNKENSLTHKRCVSIETSEERVTLQKSI